MKIEVLIKKLDYDNPEELVNFFCNSEDFKDLVTIGLFERYDPDNEDVILMPRLRFILPVSTSELKKTFLKIAISQGYIPEDELTDEKEGSSKRKIIEEYVGDIDVKIDDIHNQTLIQNQITPSQQGTNPSLIIRSQTSVPSPGFESNLTGLKKILSNQWIKVKQERENNKETKQKEGQQLEIFSLIVFGFIKGKLAFRNDRSGEDKQTDVRVEVSMYQGGIKPKWLESYLPKTGLVECKNYGRNFGWPAFYKLYGQTIHDCLFDNREDQKTGCGWCALFGKGVSFQQYLDKINEKEPRVAVFTDSLIENFLHADMKMIDFLKKALTSA